MKGDFSRMTFDPGKHFLRVLMQQGRVQLDSDWNEQTAILLHYLQTVVKDIIGPYAGPKGASGFAITGDSSRNFKIGKGRYYVDGILVENEKDVWYQHPQGEEVSQLSQPHLPAPDTAKLEDGNYLVYLDVWERHITCIQDDDIREKALGGSDTATRSKVVWQVKVMELSNRDATSCLDGAFLLDKEIALRPVCLSAKAKHDQTPIEPCLVDPESRYRGAENQLYRVEIHQGGNEPTFKWSRDNGSVVFPVKKITVTADNTSSTTAVELELEHLGRDSNFSLSAGDWVELVDDDYTLLNKAAPLLEVSSIDRMNRKVVLTGKTDISGGSAKHPFLRRWDHKKGVKSESGAIPIPLPDGGGGGWIELEDGIEIQFHIDDGSVMRSGDYWLIPARAATGDVEWPQVNGEPKPMPPHGIIHHYAPLAIITVGGDTAKRTHDCRCSFEPLSYTCTYSYYGQLGIGVDLICPDEQD